jgi:hypothetical protein
VKKQIYLYILSLTALSLLTAIVSCRKTRCHDPQNPECENYNPCFCSTKPSADFKIRQWNGWAVETNPESMEYCDTIIGTCAKFFANYETGNSYIWKIGSDVREFNGKNLEICFNEYCGDISNRESNNNVFYKPIEVSLMIITKPNSKNKIGICHSYSDTQCLTTKKLIFAYNSHLNFCGDFEGRIQGENYNRKVKIIYHYDTIVMKPFYYLVNFPNIENLDTLKIALGITGSELNTYKKKWWNCGPRYRSGSDYYENLTGVYKGKFYTEIQPNGERFLKFEYTTINKKLTSEKSYVFYGNKN